MKINCHLTHIRKETINLCNIYLKSHIQHLFSTCVPIPETSINQLSCVKPDKAILQILSRYTKLR